MLNFENISYLIHQMRSKKDMGEWMPNEYEREALIKFREMAELFAMTENDMSNKLQVLHNDMATVGCDSLAYLAEAVCDASKAKNEENESWGELYMEINNILE